MITKEQATVLVKEFETAKVEKTKKEATDFVERVVSPKVEGEAKNGGRRADVTIPKGIDCAVVCSVIAKDCGFNILYGNDPRHIILTW